MPNILDDSTRDIDKRNIVSIRCNSDSWRSIISLVVQSAKSRQSRLPNDLVATEITVCVHDLVPCNFFEPNPKILKNLKFIEWLNRSKAAIC